MKKYLLLILCMLMPSICGCGGPQKEQLNYETYIIPYQLTEDDSFECIQVREMEDEQLQQKINESFMMVMPYMRSVWLPEADYTSYETTIHLQTPKYLSVEYHFETYYAVNSMMLNSVTVGVTVDMETGEAVYLDDLVRLDEEFAEYFIKKDVARREKWSVWTAEEMTELANEIYADMGAVSVLRIFMDLSKEKESRDYEVHIRGGIYFYLEEGCLVYNHGDGLVRTRIDLKDIKDFLKVEMW